MADDAPNPRIFEGANNPPAEAPSPFDAHKLHIDGLMDEARPWLTGSEVTTEEQATTIKRLKDDFALAHKAADESRIAENEPFDKGKAAVQTKYAPLISDTKAMKGSTVLALAALNEALSPYLRRKEAEQQEAARVAREAAEEAARIAAEAAREAVGDLEASEAAEALVRAAARADADAKAAEKAKAHVKGDGRAQGLRSYWIPTIDNARVAVEHYIATDPQAVKDFLLRMAEVDIGNGKRTLPGFAITEERRV